MAVDPKSPLAKFVDNSPVGQTFRMPIRPSLAEFITEHGLMAGAQAHHEAMIQFDQQLEQAINAQLKTQPTLPAGREV